jgi:hypothetical protein
MKIAEVRPASRTSCLISGCESSPSSQFIDNASRAGDGHP